MMGSSRSFHKRFPGKYSRKTAASNGSSLSNGVWAVMVAMQNARTKSKRIKRIPKNLAWTSGNGQRKKGKLLRFICFSSKVPGSIACLIIFEDDRPIIAGDVTFSTTLWSVRPMMHRDFTARTCQKPASWSVQSGQVTWHKKAWYVTYGVVDRLVIGWVEESYIYGFTFRASMITIILASFGHSWLDAVRVHVCTWGQNRGGDEGKEWRIVNISEPQLAVMRLFVPASASCDWTLSTTNARLIPPPQSSSEKGEDGW